MADVLLSEFQAFMSFFLLLPAMAALAGLAAWRWVRPWLKFRGQRVVRCPENFRPAGVRVDAWHAGGGLRLSECSRWPAKAGCGQACLSDIAAAPEDCLVRTIAARWYQRKRCAVCGIQIGTVDWGPSEPALILADKTTVQWKQVPAEKLTETLEAALPICFACHMATTLVREHPELAIERNRPI
jgi:hypothetical protein